MLAAATINLRYYGDGLGKILKSFSQGSICSAWDPNQDTVFECFV